MDEDLSEGAAESIINLFSAIDLCAVGTQDWNYTTQGYKCTEILELALEKQKGLAGREQSRQGALPGCTDWEGRGYPPLESCFTAVRLRVITTNIPVLETSYMTAIICKRTFFFGADYSCNLFMCYLLITLHYALFIWVVKFKLLHWCH